MSKKRKKNRRVTIFWPLFFLWILLVGFLLVLVGCGSDYSTYPIITQDRSGPKGDAGSKGDSGTNGVDGFNSLFSLERFSSEPTLCPSESGVLLKSGLDTNRNNLLDQNEATAAVALCDGEQGDPGTPAPQYAIVEVVDPCGDAPGIFDEVLLKMANGTLVASFSDNANGKNTRFSLLTPGSYVTTDGSNCNFSVDSNNNVSW